jgi:hypothetical protein
LIRRFWILDHEIKGNIISFLKPNELDRVDLLQKKDQEQLSEIDKKLSILVNVLVFNAKNCKDVKNIGLARFFVTILLDMNV